MFRRNSTVELYDAAAGESDIFCTKCSFVLCTIEVNTRKNEYSMHPQTLNCLTSKTEVFYSTSECGMGRDEGEEG